MIYPIIKPNERRWRHPQIDAGRLALATLFIILVLGFLFAWAAARAEEISEGARQQLLQQPHALVRGDGAVSEAYGVPVTQSDVDLHGAVGICAVRKGDDRNPPDLSFWPELAPNTPANQPPGPCTKLNQMYEQSGAKAKYDRASADQRTEQYLAIMRAVGKQ